MKRPFLTLGALCAFAFALGTSVSAQDDAALKQRLKDQNQTQQRDDQSYRGLDRQTSGETVRASQLIGTNLENSQGEGVGEINDIVLDPRSGRIAYAAVSYGGFLNLGDKLFAVPFDAFKIKRDAEDRDDYTVILDVTEQQMEGAKGFDQDNWPNFSDQNFVRDLNQRYRTNMTQNRRAARDRNVDVDVNLDRRNE
ncbi:PRC-barrel domain containing protein [Roseiconus nitratireducens]|uniref:PRC-barrel domain containing protein n=1 Tax=Roseiconus nitratireducens TaxID=2605748 RepID=A0A5M6D5D3_9BACT|nr:PRC-barrel domain-containing protein [Roseiconus nitratireducens]KAA5542718.1 PRC-barrel domain containing protein [Roseiconus nitratireducens]